MLIDTHCHLNDFDKFPDVEAEIELAIQAGVERMILVGTKPEEWETTLELAHRHRELFAIVGWHPNYTADYSEAPLEKLRALLRDEKCLAIGEIGLDYHWDYSPRDVQYRALNDQLDLAVELDLPVVFHAREAYGDLLDLLEARPQRPYLLHCFAGSVQDGARAVNLGCWFGVDGPVTYKKSDLLRDFLRTVPRDRVVLETDSPYLTPEPHRGKTNRPAHIPLINQALASVWEMSEEGCAAKTTGNAITFFGKALVD